MENECTFATSQSQQEFEKCLACKWPLEPPTHESVRLFCSVCSALGDVPINLKFLEGNGRKDRNIAYRAYLQTGQRGIRVAILRRADGIFHFEFDLWRVDWDLRAEVREELSQKWNAQIAEHRDQIRKLRMNCCFGKTYTFFDVLPEYA